MRSLAVGVAASLAAFALITAIAGVGSEQEGGIAAAEESHSGRAVFARLGCGSCHTLAAAGSRGEIGPDLDQRLPTHDRASLIARITMTPPEGGGETFSAMPQNFGERMNARELDALVDFLLAVRRER
jgi:cytochrome c oxidase subunit II